MSVRLVCRDLSAALLVKFQRIFLGKRPSWLRGCVASWALDWGKHVQVHPSGY